MNNLIKAIGMIFILSVRTVMAESYTNSSVNVNTNGSTTSQVQTNVTTSGNTDTSVDIKNEIKSSSSNSQNVTIYKRIETNVNGEKKVIESNQPGETKIEIHNGEVTVISTPSATIIPTENLPKPTRVIPPINNKNMGQFIVRFMQNIRKEVVDFIKSILGNQTPAIQK